MVATAASARPAGTKVLIIDGVVASRVRVARWLREVGYSVVRASTVSAGTAVLRVNSDIGLLVIAHSPPVANALETVKWVRASSQHARLPIAVLGGTLKMRELRYLLAVPDCVYLPAPAQRDRFLSEIETLGRQRVGVESAS